MKILHFILILGVCPTLFGQLLFEIKSKDNKTSSYLFGTIHMMPKDSFRITKPLEESIKKCQTMAMEIDLNMDLATKISLAKQTVLPNGESLKDIMQPKDYSRLKSYCLDSLNIGSKKFERYSKMKPFFFSSLLLQSDLEKTASYEVEFNELAQKKGIKTMGLESVEAQFQTINSISNDEQIEMLMDGLGQKFLYDDMLRTYQSEDLDKLYLLITEESESFPDFIENFLNKRNRNWIPVMDRQITKGPTFFAVGAGHLPGEQGVIQLLKNKGYEVVPMSLH